MEGIFDAIALAHHGIAAVALMSCGNYPAKALDALRAQIQREGQQVKEPRLVFALDGDKAGRDYTVRHVRRAQEAGWRCTAAQIPQRTTATKLDWNDLHLRDRLVEKDLKEYLHQGALLVAESALDKALLIYNHTGRTEFDLEHGSRLFWFKLDLTAYSKAKDDLEKGQEEGAKFLSERELREKAIEQAAVLQPIANCLPRALYYQRNEVTQEAWYYFSIAQPHESQPVKGTFTAGHLTSASEFKKLNRTGFRGGSLV